MTPQDQFDRFNPLKSGDYSVDDFGDDSGGAFHRGGVSLWIAVKPSRAAVALLGNHRGIGRMIKSELVQKLADEHPNLFHRDIERLVSILFDEIGSALVRGDRVELRGFGAFSVKRRPARVGRNPRTGAPVPIDEKFSPFFKPGKELRDRLNNGDNG